MDERERDFLFQLSDAVAAHRQMLAALVAEVALLTSDPDGFLTRLKDDDEDLSISSLADPNTSAGLKRGIFEGQERERQSVFEYSRLMLKLKKALRSELPPGR